MLPFDTRWQLPPNYQPPIQAPVQAPVSVLSDKTQKCMAVTKSGKKCKNGKMKNSQYCNIHQRKNDK